MPRVLHADLTWTEDGFVRDARVVVDDDGRVAEVRRDDGGGPVERLAGCALLPGFANAHSHAFQRGLRGHGETFVEGAGSFWSWREAMYDLVARLDPDGLYELSRQAFGEMRAAGITSVGEFHYFRHDATGAGHAMDDAVVRAAADTGIRLVLLIACYMTGGIGVPLAGGQTRFRTTTLDDYWRQFDALGARLDATTQSLGVVAHSIRAMPIDDIVALHEESARRGHVFHMHVEEQPREIEECLRAEHHTPMRLLCERGVVDPRMTAVHCTHTAAADMEDFLDAGGTVCICPLTEANLGDGIADLPSIRRHGGRICVGTDSNARLSMLEELRWLEYAQRLRTQSRGVITDDDGDVARALLEIGTRNGCHALGLRGGRVRAGDLADFVIVDRSASALAGASDETLLGALLLGAGNEAIRGTVIGGVVSNRS